MFCLCFVRRLVSMPPVLTVASCFYFVSLAFTMPLKALKMDDHRVPTRKTHNMVA